MEVCSTSIHDVLLVKPRVFRDARGFFVETFQQRRYAEAGIAMPFVQDNRSRSRKHTLRGLHFQLKHPQGKLVYALTGSVYDVAVDIRPDSPTFGVWYGVELSEENHYQLWVPPGLAHGFYVLSDTADFCYKCTEYYVPNDEGGILWNDPDLGIDWPLPGTGEPPVLSEKDAGLPLFNDIDWRALRA